MIAGHSSSAGEQTKTDTRASRAKLPDLGTQRLVLIDHIYVAGSGPIKRTSKKPLAPGCAEYEMTSGLSLLTSDYFWLLTSDSARVAVPS